MFVPSATGGTDSEGRINYIENHVSSLAATQNAMQQTVSCFSPFFPPLFHCVLGLSKCAARHRISVSLVCQGRLSVAETRVTAVRFVGVFWASRHREAVFIERIGDYGVGLRVMVGLVTLM